MHSRKFNKKQCSQFSTYIVGNPNEMNVTEIRWHFRLLHIPVALILLPIKQNPVIFIHLWNIFVYLAGSELDLIPSIYILANSLPAEQTAMYLCNKSVKRKTKESEQWNIHTKFCDTKLTKFGSCFIAHHWLCCIYSRRF